MVTAVSCLIHEDINKNCEAVRNEKHIIQIAQDIKLHCTLYGIEATIEAFKHSTEAEWLPVLFLGRTNSEIELVKMIKDHSDACGAEHENWIFFEKERT